MQYFDEYNAGTEIELADFQSKLSLKALISSNEQIGWFKNEGNVQLNMSTKDFIFRR